jgi:hypothetical protein
VVKNHEDRRPSILSRSVAVNITAAHWALSISYFIYLSIYIYLHSSSIEKMLLISRSDKTSYTVSSTIVDIQDIQCTYTNSKCLHCCMSAVSGTGTYTVPVLQVSKPLAGD